MIWANWSLDWITVGRTIYVNALFLSWSEQTWQTCYLLVQMTIYGGNSDLGHIFQDVGSILWLLSVWSTLVWWLTTTHSPQNIRFIRAEAVTEYSPRNKDNSAHGCNTRFSIEMATKRKNVRTGALNSVLIRTIWILFIHEIFYLGFMNVVLSIIIACRWNNGNIKNHCISYEVTLRWMKKGSSFFPEWNESL